MILTASKLPLILVKAVVTSMRVNCRVKAILRCSNLIGSVKAICAASFAFDASQMQPKPTVRNLQSTFLLRGVGKRPRVSSSSVIRRVDVGVTLDYWRVQKSSRNVCLPSVERSKTL